MFYGKTHNFLILLNRQRPEAEEGSPTRAAAPSTGDASSTTLRGRERVLDSARSLLYAFEFFHTRVRVAMICWTMGQQAFNAAMILTLSLLHPVWTSAEAAEAARDDYYLVHRAYATFVEMHHKGIHKLAGVACTKLSALLMQLHPVPTGSGFGRPEPPREAMDTVMGSTGMVLLEDPGLQGFVAEGFSPLGFQMAGGQLPAHGLGSAGVGVGAGIGSPGWSARAAPPMPVSSSPSTTTGAVGTGFGAPFGPAAPAAAAATAAVGGGGAPPAFPYPATAMPGPTYGRDVGLGSSQQVQGRSGSGSMSGARAAQASSGSDSERPQVGPKPETLRVSSGFQA